MLKSQLKNIVSNNILLYYLWFKLIRQQKGLDVGFFKRDTDLYIDGYPRSGNTFIYHLIKNLLPEVNMVHHLHTVAPIKISLWMKLPTFILIRNPMDCISSNYLKHFSMRGMEVGNEIDESLLDVLMTDYLNYHNFVLSNKDRIGLIFFDDLISSPHIIMEKIQAKLDIKEDLTDDSIEKVKKTYKGATNTIGSSRPNPTKEKYKSVVKESISASGKYDSILKTYELIIKP